ncbi:MAG: helix-turn-helix transcriptional regulator [Thaumarchaeota archaeon]|nr:helix-turn-helix transcriptional regulator [Nitrososphaerota archaeon]
MKEKRLLIRKDREGILAKDILVSSEPTALRPLLNPITWKIANLLVKKPMYSAQIARELKIHEQTVYFHVRRLVKAGLLKKEKEEVIKGAVARYYSMPYGALGLEFPKGEQQFASISTIQLSDKVRSLTGGS